jgi:uncharacterized membrane protein YagU involved in acid resistance
MLDITYAIAVYGALGVPPVRIFQSIASGLLGSDAYDGGLATAILGGVLHFCIATAMAAGYLFLSGRLDRMRIAPLFGGFVYGLFLFLLMYLVVVPLSASNVTMPSGRLMTGALFAHTVLVGIPIAFVVRFLSAGGGGLRGLAGRSPG